MITLRPMSKQRHDHWAGTLWQVYYQELIRAGYSEEYARENSAEDPNNSIEYGKLQPGNIVLEAVYQDEAIGNVWLVQKDSEWWIYDIEVDDNHRGEGLGRATLRAIEKYVREQGGEKLNLSVFGFNKVARNLYESEGFNTVRIQMSKPLS